MRKHGGLLRSSGTESLKQLASLLTAPSKSKALTTARKYPFNVRYRKVDLNPTRRRLQKKISSDRIFRYSRSNRSEETMKRSKKR